jgi:hypothetical protein
MDFGCTTLLAQWPFVGSAIGLLKAGASFIRFWTLSAAVLPISATHSLIPQRDGGRNCRIFSMTGVRVDSRACSASHAAAESISATRTSTAFVKSGVSSSSAASEFKAFIS